MRKRRNPSTTDCVPRAIFSRSAAGAAPSAVLIAHDMRRADHGRERRGDSGGGSGDGARGGGWGNCRGGASCRRGVAGREKGAAPSPCESRPVGQGGGIAVAGGVECRQQGAQLRRGG